MKLIRNDINVNLSERESEIIQLITYEYSSKEIAEELFLSVETIKTYRASIMRKLRVKNVAGIVREAIFQNMIQIQQRAIV